MDRIFTYLIDLPTEIHEIVMPCADGFTVYLNARLSQEGMEEAYDHAMFHIVHNDFSKENVQEIEHEAHRSIHESQF